MLSFLQNYLPGRALRPGQYLHMGGRLKVSACVIESLQESPYLHPQDYCRACVAAAEQTACSTRVRHCEWCLEVSHWYVRGLVAVAILPTQRTGL